MKGNSSLESCFCLHDVAEITWFFFFPLRKMIVDLVLVLFFAVVGAFFLMLYFWCLFCFVWFGLFFF